MGVRGAEAAATVPESPPAVIRMEEGLPGWPDQREWELVRHPDADPFLWLRSRQEPALALLLLDPRVAEPDFAPGLPRDTGRRLELGPDDRPLVLCVVTLGQGQERPATINLRAPLIINPRTLRGAQVILDRGDLPLARPLAAAAD